MNEETNLFNWSTGPSATDIRKPLETGTETEKEYFGDTEDENPSFGLLEVAYDGDAENSASDSDNGKCDSVDEFKSVICKGKASNIFLLVLYQRAYLIKLCQDILHVPYMVRIVITFSTKIIAGSITMSEIC